MPELTTISLGSIQLSTYTVLIAAAVLMSGGWALWQAPTEERSAWADVYLGGLVGGILLARLVHVVLNWNHFAFHSDEIIHLQAGGLDWHGAVIGALFGMLLVSRWRQVEFGVLLDKLTLALPLIALAAWVGCWIESCAYGREVTSLADYPSWLVWEGRDIFGLYAPRFQTQLVGIMVALVLFVLSVIFLWRGLLLIKRFWIILLLLSLGMFGIGFLRGDYALHWDGLRFDQVLDVILFGFSIVLIWRVR